DGGTIIHARRAEPTVTTSEDRSEARHEGPDETRTRVHVFRDDALGDHDAVSLAEAIRRGEVSAAEAARDAAARVRAADARLHAVEAHLDLPARDAGTGGAHAGAPPVVTPTTGDRGLPPGPGSLPVGPGTPRQHAPLTRQFLRTGVTVLGKTRLPEFGFNARTEYGEGEAVRNPWDTGHSA